VATYGPLLEIRTVAAAHIWMLAKQLKLDSQLTANECQFTVQLCTSALTWLLLVHSLHQHQGFHAHRIHGTKLLKNMSHEISIPRKSGTSYIKVCARTNLGS